MKKSHRLPLLTFIAILAGIGVLLLARIPGVGTPGTSTKVLVLVLFAVLLVPALWVWLRALRDDL